MVLEIGDIQILRANKMKTVDSEHTPYCCMKYLKLGVDDE